MPLVVTHQFVSAIPDSADGTRVRPSNWNANHALSGTLDVSQGGTGQTTEAEALGEMIQALTEDTTPDTAADYLVTYDGSADTGKKVKVQNVQAGRVVLTSQRIYYVRKDGSDSNDGLTNSAGGAFLTIGKAMDEVGKLDVGIGGYGLQNIPFSGANFLILVLVGNGTYSESVDLPKLLGSGLYSDDISGHEAIAGLMPIAGYVDGDVVIDGGGALWAVGSTNTWGWDIRGLTLRSGYVSLQITEESVLRVDDCVIDMQDTLIGLQVYDHSECYLLNTLKIGGTTVVGIDVWYASTLHSNGKDIRYVANAVADDGTNGAVLQVGFGGIVYGSTFSLAGGVTVEGARFKFDDGGGVIRTNAVGWYDLNYPPGDVNGILEWGGFYNGLTLEQRWPDTFANLPVNPREGMAAIVTDSNTATWGATITGTGANHVLAYYNGTNWTVSAK